ncbi:hypothetical protein W97_05465 [Coniosporium apollinis CBS 100218]|uniref:Uncharacterized protein n=1 Tax=Coniosporium apollinis (strain CBS 100218) TaxID=1168221 RepID=R7YWZ9_CONA1|nr:uncharacterized protein W97_05465 [Coniosporium apollinis CBS 100218]EON66368.1 hypothetical protein W97_05465 [Coniosporium apollinis CBS 100218]
MASKMQKLLLCVVLALLIALSIVILALEISTLNFMDYAWNHGFHIFLDPSSDDVTAYLKLSGPYSKGSDFTFAVSIISLVAGAAALPFSIWLWRTDKKLNAVKPREGPYTLLAALTATAALSLALLLMVFVSNARAAGFDVATQGPPPYWYDHGPSGEFSEGYFDLEAWVCDLATFAGVRRRRDLEVLSKQCGIEKAARWILVPFFGVSVVAAGLGWWAMRGEKGDGDDGVTLDELRSRMTSLERLVPTDNRAVV